MKAQSPAGTILKNDNLKKSPKDTLTIIGIDPGLQNLGIGIIQISCKKQIKTQEIPITKKRSKTYYPPHEIAKCLLGYSCITFKLKQTRTLETRLYYIYENLCQLIEEHQPNLVIVEDAFVGINKNAAMKLGLSRGCILTVLGRYKTKYIAIPPKRIKMEFANNGAAQKEEIYDIFSKVLKKWSRTSLDSSDALAAAFCGVKWLNTK